jgi:predicted transcriptional regulator
MDKEDKRLREELDGSGVSVFDLESMAVGLVDPNDQEANEDQGDKESEDNDTGNEPDGDSQTDKITMNNLRTQTYPHAGISSSAPQTPPVAAGGRGGNGKTLPSALANREPIETLFPIGGRDREGNTITDHRNLKSISDKKYSGVKSLWARNRIVLKMHMAGYTAVEIAAHTGLSLASVSNSINSKLGHEAMLRWEDHDMGEQTHIENIIRAEQLNAVTVIAGMLHDKETSSAIRFKAACRMLDMQGNSPIKKQETKTKHQIVTADDLSQVRARVAEELHAQRKGNSYKFRSYVKIDEAEIVSQNKRSDQANRSEQTKAFQDQSAEQTETTSIEVIHEHDKNPNLT